MDRKEFLSRVLPANGGDYFSHSIKDGNHNELKHGSIDGIDNWATKNLTSKNVYFATGVYGGRRLADKTKLKRALYLDLDVGASEPNKPKYASQADAVKALIAFCKACFVAPTIIVNSGRGIHAYWTFEQAVALNRWQRMANALKELTKAHSLLTDHQVTTDAARIMRLPDTWNFRSGAKPVPTDVYWHSSKDYSAAAIETKLQLLHVAPPVAVGDDDLSGGMEPRSIGWKAARMVEQCPMFKSALDTGGVELPEPIWTNQLNVLAYCVDGEEFIHKISNGHMLYTEADTNKKFSEKVAGKGNAGPTTCAKFMEHGATQCETCPHRGTIKSPVVLGGSRGSYLPFPFDQDDDGVFFMAADKDATGAPVQIRVTVLKYSIADFDVVQADGALWLSFVAKSSGDDAKVVLKYTALIDKQACRGELGNQYVILSAEEYPFFVKLMSTWSDQMQKAKRVKHAYARLGWIENNSGFVLSEEAIHSDGSRETHAALDDAMHRLYKPTGEAAPWIKAAALLTANDRMASIVALGTAFAAPLSPWLSDASALMSFVSRSSGTGKTTALVIAQAVWGDPKHAMFQLDDTENSVYHKLGFANNLPGYWDELKSNDQTDRIGKMLFKLTTGRDKSRLTQGIELRKSGSWNTMLTVASNSSISDAAIREAGDTEAGMARVFELTMPALLKEERTQEMDQALVQMLSNYGVIGVKYAEFLVRNATQCQSTLHAVYARFDKALNPLPVERFWMSSISKILCGLMFAKHLGFIDIDLHAVWKYLCHEFLQQRAERSNEFNSITVSGQSTDIVMEFMSHHRDNSFVYDWLPGRRGGVGRTHTIPRPGEVVMSVGVQDTTLRVARTAFRTWLQTKKKGTPKTILSTLNYTQHRRRLTDEQVSPPIWCLEFDLTQMADGNAIQAIADFTDFEDLTASEPESTDTETETDLADR